MILRIMSNSGDVTEYDEYDVDATEMESVYMEFLRGEPVIQLIYKDGSKSAINSKFVSAIHLESEED